MGQGIGCVEKKKRPPRFGEGVFVTSPASSVSYEQIFIFKEKFYKNQNQSSSFKLGIFSKCLVLCVTSVIPFEIAVAEISKSMSSTGFPIF